eukprot:m.352596 g.352596  ORF g.352596 m.352596 type:complete len:224 (-) comp16556_c0_seq1:393-1064(-)
MWCIQGILSSQPFPASPALLCFYFRLIVASVVDFGCKDSTHLPSVMSLLGRFPLARTGVVMRVAFPRLAPAMTQTRCMSVKIESGDKKWVGLTNDQDFFKKNQNMQRPTSPFLFTYSYPPPAILSISHRGTGLALTMFTLASGIALAFNPLSFYLDAIQAMNLSSTTFIATKFTLAFPLAYHTFNGIRHLVWDAGKGMDMSSHYKTGFTVVALASVVAAYAAM